MLRVDELKSSNTLFPYVVQRRCPADAPSLDHRHKHQWWASHTVVVRSDYCPFLMSTKHPWTDRRRLIWRLETLTLNKGSREARRTALLLPRQASHTFNCSQVFSDPLIRLPRPGYPKQIRAELDKVYSRARRRLACF